MVMSLKILLSYSIEAIKFDVEAMTEHLVAITWSPKEPGNCRQMVRFYVDDTYRLMAYVLGQCPQPPLPKKVHTHWLLIVCTF